MRPLLFAIVLVACAASVGCGGGAKSPTAAMPRFNPALCPAPPREDTSRPLDPNLDGVGANLALLSRTVTSTKGVHIALTFRNGGQHGVSISLPQSAFSLAGFTLVDHDCKRVPYVASPTTRALHYGGSGPMPLKIGESATVDTALDDLAPGLVLQPGIYALRLSLPLIPESPVIRGETLRSDWALFALVPSAAP
jgi:hypothetical protein